MAKLTETQTNLMNLLLYTEQMLRVTERFTSDLSKDAVAHFHEHELASLEGVSTGVADDAWIRVERLAETPPPEPDTRYAQWLVKPGVGALDRPALVRQRLERLPVEAISDLMEAGLADPEDAKPTGAGGEAPGQMDVLLRLDRLPAFAAAFEAWVEGSWSDWVRRERPRRRSIAFYNKLFETQQRMVAMGEDASVECILGVGVARWKTQQRRLDLPLIEATVELDLDGRDGAIIVRPRPMPPRVALRAFEELDSVSIGTLARDASDRLQRSHDDPDVGFNPFEPTCFDPVLRMCHARLSASSVYLADDGRTADDRSVPAADDRLQISNTWVLFLRQRSTDSSSTLAISGQALIQKCGSEAM